MGNLGACVGKQICPRSGHNHHILQGRSVHRVIHANPSPGATCGYQYFRVKAMSQLSLMV
jgi:hypothetical protein